MLVTTTDIIPGTQVQILGLVRGNIVTSKNVGRDIMASARNLVGGEVKSYTDMSNEARDVATNRMVSEAQAMGADAIMAMRFGTSVISPGMIEMLAYGTAVKIVS